MSDMSPAAGPTPGPESSQSVDNALIEFFEAQLAADEQVIAHLRRPYGDNNEEFELSLYVVDDDYRHETIAVPKERVRRDIKADRDLIHAYREARNGSAPAGEVRGLWSALQIRVARYAGQPGYQEGWQP